MTSSELRRFIKALPGMFLVLRPDAQFTIAAASDDYLRISCRDESIFGRPLFEVFPDNPADPQASGVANLTASLKRVIDLRKPDVMARQRYDVRFSAAPDAPFDRRYWAPINSPILSDDGQVEYIVHRVDDAGTEPVHLSEKERIQAEREQLLAESDKQRRIYEAALDSTPDFVYVFDLDHSFRYANKALVEMFGMPARGKRWLELGYEPWHADMHDREIDQVITTKMPIRGEVPFTGTNGRRIYDYIFAPVLGADGEVVAVAGTTRDVTQRKEAEQAMGEHARQLAESDRAKDEFLATLSHELRNPLAPLRNSIALLKLMGGSDAKAANVHDMMERQVNHLVRLVDDLLEVSRISRGTLTLRRERTRLDAVMRNAVETSEPLFKAARQELTVELPREPLWLNGDPVRLAQIIDNLLNNAAKYTQEGGRISLRAGHDGTHAVITVSDNGPGISAQALPRLFEMFSRGDHDASRHPSRGQGGLGIGLALSRRLAQMHDGTLDAHSAGPGQGSEFTLRLPLAERPAETTPTPEAPAESLGKTRVLVVDDNEDAGDSLGQILEMLGADVRVARDGPQALDQFAAYGPSVVLLDIGMPGMDGYEVARAIRVRHPDKPATLVALTGWGQDEDRKRAREAGFDHHMVKPAELDALQRLLSSLEGSASAS